MFFLLFFLGGGVSLLDCMDAQGVLAQNRTYNIRTF